MCVCVCVCVCVCAEENSLSKKNNKKQTDNEFFFLVDEGRDDPIITISGPKSAFRCRADDGPTLNVGLVTL